MTTQFTPKIKNTILETKAPRIFLSYASEDKEISLGIAKYLKETIGNRGVIILHFDREYKKIGTPFNPFMDLINHSEIVIVICSSNYKRKCSYMETGVGWEYNLIEKRYQYRSNEFLLVPFFIEGYQDAPFLLVGVQGPKFNNNDPINYENSFQKIMNELVNDLLDYLYNNNLL